MDMLKIFKFLEPWNSFTQDETCSLSRYDEKTSIPGLKKIPTGP